MAHFCAAAMWFVSFAPTTFLAIWGAILSSITFGWTLYRDLRDRAKVKVTAQVRRIVQREDGAFFSVNPELGIPGASKELFVVVSVVNIGRRRMRWKGLKRDGHAEGYVDGYDAGHEAGIHKALGIKPEDLSEMHEFANDMRIDGMMIERMDERERKKADQSSS
jgi:hypothetical protein